MLRQRLTLPVSKNDKDFCLMLPDTTSYGEVYDVLTEMRAFIISKIHEENEASKPKTEEKPPEQET